jgi:hypothetical protein
MAGTLDFVPAAYGKVRPGRIWYIPALAVLAAGLAWLIVGLTSVIGIVDGLQRVPVPGHGTVDLTHRGGYTVYYEGAGARRGSIPFFHVSVVPASPGAAVAHLTQYGSAVTYNIGSHDGRAVLALQVRSPGRFTVTTTGTAQAGGDLAFGGSLGSGIVTALVPSIPLIIVGFGGWLLVLILRLNGKRRAQRAWA